MTEELKYEFDLNDPDSWAKMPRPTLPESFIKETLKVGGLNKHGQPRFKWVWGGSEEVYIESDGTFPAGWYIKYEIGHNEKIVGYQWRSSITGEMVTVPTHGDVPDGAIAIPVIKREQIGKPRWILERWQDEGDMNGIYDRSGYYHHETIVQEDKPEGPSMLKPYREPAQYDLDRLAHWVQLTHNLTDKDIEEGVKQDREKEAADVDKARAESKEEITEAIVEILHELPPRPQPPKAVVQKALAGLERATNQTL
jgi:hypothetical protein